MAGFDNPDFQRGRNDDTPIAIFRYPTEEEMEIDERKSKEAGHPVYKEMVLCEIRIPADRNRIMVAPHTAECIVDGVKTTYAERFAREYQAFVSKTGPTVLGTPLHEGPFISAAKRAELRALSVHTLEALAALEGQQLKNIGMGGRELKEQAKAYLANAQGSAVVTRLASENEQLKDMLAQMRAEIDAMQGKSALGPSQLVKQVDDFGGAEGQEPEEKPSTGSAFEFWEDADIKQFIKKKTGEAPRGNISHASLVVRAEEVKGYDNAE